MESETKPSKEQNPRRVGHSQNILNGRSVAVED